MVMYKRINVRGVCMKGELNNKVVIITGAGRGIGRAIALSFASKGAKVSCIARTENEIKKTAAQIKEIGGESIALSCDVSDYEEVKRVIHTTYETFGSIDIAVINAGIDIRKISLEETNVEEWKKVIDINLTGAFYTAKAIIPYMKKQREGKIITLGSGLGHKGRVKSGAYSCSKAGLWMLTRVLAQELYDYNISVNELVPGPVITRMGNDSMKGDESVFSEGSEWIKTPEDVTELALFIATQPKIGPSGQSFSLMRRDL